MRPRLEFLKWLVITATVVLLVEPAYSTDPKFSLSDSGNVRLSVSNTSGETRVLMKAENLSAADIESKDPPRLEDVGSIGPTRTTIQFTSPKESDRGANSRAWLWTATVKDFPVHSAQKRSARLIVGKIEQYVEYTLTDLPPSPLGISITAPSNPWFVWHGFIDSRTAMGIVVKTGDFPVTNFRLAQAALLNNPASWQLGLEDLELCETLTVPCGMISIDARTIRTLYLRLKTEARHHGTYAGIVGFAVNERPELENLNITVHASSALAKVAGGGVLALGIFLAWWVSVWARSRTLRLEALRPVAILHESIMALRGELENAPKVEGVNLGHTKKALGDIDQSLTTTSLDAANRLPSEIPRPFASGSDSAGNLQKHLAEQGARVDGLRVVIQDGMKKVWQKWKVNLSDKERKAIQKGLMDLDERGGDVKDLATAQKLVLDVLTEYSKAITPQGAQADATLLQSSLPSTQHLIWAIGQLHRLVWATWGSLALASGVVSLILPNMGFGTMFDFIVCFLWGFGLPTAVDRLQQLGPSGIASTMGVSLPKATP